MQIKGLLEFILTDVQLVLIVQENKVVKHQQKNQTESAYVTRQDQLINVEE